MLFANHGSELKFKQKYISANACSVCTAWRRTEIEIYHLSHNNCAPKIHESFWAAPRGCGKRKFHHMMILVAMNIRIFCFRHSYASNLAAFFILFLGIFRNGLLVIVNKKWENSLLHRRDLCFRRLGMYIAPYKQEAPHNSLTVDSVMSQLGPSHGRYICLKHRVAIFRPK